MQIFLLVFSVLLISKINADFWYSYQFGSDFGNREELVIKTVDAIDDFQSVNKVGKWKSVSLNSNFYAVGVTVQNGKNGVVLLHAFAKETEESFHTNETVIELEASKIFDVAIFHYEEDIIVTAAVQMKSNENEIKLIWFKIDYFNVHSFEYLDLTYMLISDSTCLSKLYIWSPEGLHFERIVDLGIVQQMVSVNDLDSLYFVTRDSTDGSICNYTGSNVWKFEEESINLIHKLPQQKLLHESKIPAVFYAMDNEGVTEFRITPNDELLINPVQKWLIPTENADFVSHGLKTGLAIRNGHHLFQLLRDQGQENYLFDQNMQAITLGNVTKQLNNFMPGSSDGEMLITKVGRPRWHTLLSVTNFEETKIKDFDTIKIYEDPMKGIKYQNLKAYKPSSLLSLEFEDNAETLIAFLEDEKLLKIYEYKGIEGFKFKSEATLEATKLVPLKLPTKFGRKTNFIAAIKKNLLNLIEVKMDGNQMMVEKVDCNT